MIETDTLNPGFLCNKHVNLNMDLTQLQTDKLPVPPVTGYPWWSHFGNKKMMTTIKDKFMSSG